jgi:hypothetical protein
VVANAVAGAGVISADGGSGVFGVQGASGGGGRVAVDAPAVADTLRLSAAGGSPSQPLTYLPVGGRCAACGAGNTGAAGAAGTVAASVCFPGAFGDMALSSTLTFCTACSAGAYKAFSSPPRVPCTACPAAPAPDSWARPCAPPAPRAPTAWPRARWPAPCRSRRLRQRGRGVHPLGVHRVCGRQVHHARRLGRPLRHRGRGRAP